MPNTKYTICIPVVISIKGTSYNVCFNILRLLIQEKVFC